MKYIEKTFVRDGKVIFRFEMEDGTATEVETPEAAESMRRFCRADRKEAPRPAPDAGAPGTFAGKLMTGEDEAKAHEMLDSMRRMLFQGPPQQQLPVTMEDASLPAKTPANPDPELPDRIKIEDYIKTGKWNEMFDLSLYAGAALTAPRKDLKIPLLPGMYHGHGGKQLKKKLKDEATRKEAYDEAMSAQFTEMEMLRQVCMSYLGGLDDAGFIKELKDRNSPLHTVIALMMRINNEMRNLMVTDFRLRGAVPSQLNINSAAQVFVGAQGDGHGSNMGSQKGSPLIKSTDQEETGVSGKSST